MLFELEDKKVEESNERGFMVEPQHSVGFECDYVLECDCLLHEHNRRVWKLEDKLLGTSDHNLAKLIQDDLYAENSRYCEALADLRRRYGVSSGFISKHLAL